MTQARFPRYILLLGAFAAVPAVAVAQTAAPSSDARLILVTIDGVRWQDLFRGADPELAADKAQTKKAAEVHDRYIAPADRPRALAPFLHSFPQRGGVLIGNRDQGSCMRVANRYWFSYPGYSEMLTGRVGWANSNAPVDNPDTTVLEWLNRQPGYAGHVRVFATWAVFPAIVNAKRSGIPVNAGLVPLPGNDPEIAALNKVQNDLPRPWNLDERYDALTHAFGLRSLTVDAPGVLHVAYGEPDAHAHAGAYDEYLIATERADRFARELWDAAQADPAWAGKTTLIVTTDHGRGELGPLKDGWRHHGSGLDEAGMQHPERARTGSDQSWAAILGPAPLVAEAAPGVCATASQIAATALQALGFDRSRYDPRSAPPLVCPVGE